jgi:hypothetical protein
MVIFATISASRLENGLPMGGDVAECTVFGYGPPLAKLVGGFRAGKVTAAICLVSNRGTETKWFQSLWDGVQCFVDNRIQFDNTTRERAATGSVFVYFGPHPARFAKHFEQFGAS